VSAAAASAVNTADVILRDGSTLRLRSPVTEDGDALLEFFSGLSEHSRYLRFHGFPLLGPALVEGGQTIVLVEQNLSAALSLADRVYVINNGYIVESLGAEAVRNEPHILHQWLAV